MRFAAMLFALAVSASAAIAQPFPLPLPPGAYPPGALPAAPDLVAAMDGASRARVLRSIVLPLLMPGVVATAMFSFVSAWNEFFFALVLIQSPANYTLPITLAMFVGGEGKVALGPLAAGAVLATIPSLIFFAFLQRKLTGGLLAGAVKG